MMQHWTKWAAVSGLALTLSACDASVDLGDAVKADGNATVGGKAQDGRVTINAPGLDLSVNIPDALLDPTQIQQEGRRLLPPAAAFSGIHVQSGENGGGVEIAFTSPQAPAALAEWYRAAERARDVAVQSVVQQGTAFVVQGTTIGAQDAFSVRLTPSSAGTEGRLVIGSGGTQ